MEIIRVRRLIRTQARYIYLLVKVNDSNVLVVPETMDSAIVMLEGIGNEQVIDASYDPESKTLYIGRE